MRVAEGVGAGVTFPAMHVILAHWAPPLERSIMSSVVYSGTALGTVIFMFVSSLIGGEINWEAIFYLEGALSSIWLIIWAIMIADSPQNQKFFISEEEKEYIDKCLNQGGENTGRKSKPKIPWKAVWTSIPFLAILVANICSNWGWYLLLTQFPTYMKTVLNYNISESAVLTAVPFMCMWVFTNILSTILDKLREKKTISTGTARKIATGFSSVVPMICYITLCYVGTQRVLALVTMTIAIMSIGGMFCGFLSNHIDIAPNFAGTLVGVTNSIGTIPGILAPVYVGKLTEYDNSVGTWRIIFWTTVAIYVVEIAVYMPLASGKEQSWNKGIESAGDDRQ